MRKLFARTNDTCSYEEIIQGAPPGADALRCQLCGNIAILIDPKRPAFKCPKCGDVFRDSGSTKASERCCKCDIDAPRVEADRDLSSDVIAANSEQRQLKPIGKDQFKLLAWITALFGGAVAFAVGYSMQPAHDISVGGAFLQVTGAIMFILGTPICVGSVVLRFVILLDQLCRAAVKLASRGGVCVDAPQKLDIWDCCAVMESYLRPLIFVGMVGLVGEAIAANSPVAAEGFWFMCCGISILLTCVLAAMIYRRTQSAPLHALVISGMFHGLILLPTVWISSMWKADQWWSYQWWP